MFVKNSLFVIIAVVFGLLLMYNSSMIPTGFATISGEFGYTDNVSIWINESQSYEWILDNFGDLKSLRLDGNSSKNFVGKVYLERDRISYIILDSSRFGSEGIGVVTGMAVLNESNVNYNDVTEFNESEVNAGETNITEINLTENNATSVNESGYGEDVENASEISDNRSISIDIFGGGRKSMEEMFRFNISSLFSWDIDYTKICTKWDVGEYSVCYGSSDCCDLVGLESYGEWNDTFYLSYGRYDAGLNNNVEAQVIYANYSVSVDDPYSDILYSEVKSTMAEFYEERIEFSDVCIETCLLGGWNDSSYSLRIEVSEGNLAINSIRYSVEKTINLSDTNITVSEELIKPDVVINKPVKWIKRVGVSEPVVNLTINISSDALNVTVKDVRKDKIIEDEKVRINESGEIKSVDEYEASKKDSKVKKKGVRLLAVGKKEKEKKKDIGILIEEAVDSIEVEYYTEAPISKETAIKRGKRVVVSSDVHYEDILAYTYLDDVSREDIRLYWVVNDSKRMIGFDGYDQNEDGLIDYIEWIVPSLSNQTYEVIIEITKAEHLDSNRVLIEDIYDYVSVKDYNWSPIVENNEYVRVTFEQALDSSRDITIYARSFSSASIEVYTEDSDVLISTFENVGLEGWYKIYLTSLNGSHEVFDLRSIGIVEYDYIVDPMVGVSGNISLVDPTPYNDSIQATDYVEVNISIVANLSEAKFNWNGTNYTLYNDSLVLMYNFDNISALGEDYNNTENYTVFDASVYGNNGTVSGNGSSITGALWNVSGRFGGGFEFDGVDDYIHIPASDDLSFGTGNFSLAAWVKTGSNSTQYVIDRWDYPNGKDSEYAIFVQDGYPNFLIRETLDEENDYALAVSTLRINDSDWHYLVGVRKNITVYVYVDGIEMGSADASSVGALVTTGQTNIGVHAHRIYYYNSLNYFNGSIDEVRVWNRSLSKEEVYQQYVSNLNRYSNDVWYLYINQSLNGSDGLSDGDYTYSGYVRDSAGNENSTENRRITVESIYPSIEFTGPTPATGTSTTNTSIEVNITITESDLDEVRFNWNKTNYTHYNDSLVLFMNFDNVSSLGEGYNNSLSANETVVDLSNAGNNGTTVTNTTNDGPIWNKTGGRYGGAFEFDGVDDFIDAGNDKSLQITGAVTLGAWVKINSSYTGGIVCKQSNAQGGYDLGFGNLNVGKPILNIYVSGVWYRAEADDTYNDGEWHHIVGVANGSTVSIYVDGVGKEGDTYSGSIADNTGSLTIGTRINDGTNPFNGTIDNVMVWNTSLSSEEIYQLYISNLRKYDVDKWNLYLNQSLNATDGLVDGSYGYSGYAKDNAGNENSTELRSVTVDRVGPSTNFTGLTPANGSSQTEGHVRINVSIDESSLGEVKFNWNGTNYTYYNNSCVLIFNFDNVSSLGEQTSGPGNKTVDVSGYGNNGTIYGPFWNNTGRYGGAFEFDGIDDYINVSDSDELDANRLSIEFWFKPASTYNASTSYVSFVYHDNYEIAIRDGNMVFQYGENNLSSVIDSWNKGQWYHVLATYDGTTQMLYLTGADEASALVSAPFVVMNSNSERTASFFDSGDIILMGSVSSGSCEHPGDDAFIVQDITGDTVAYVNSTGDMCTEDSDTVYSHASCDNPGDGSFIVKDSSDSIVSYINATGDLCLRGTLTENGNP